ncbi:hypothetical protein H257_05817 [Aphanomyces astaci]|uniref:Uncharacterized protein n=1 Tax=Aphanomyces astaci TaxID=112090 RepID=W4GQF9_APHAT|nr:hypothetical protein H257_05817 [Aphanomyces astaci]ETV81254.1 hypothetical protein H257_05817 [Aphanomyces astaci]|eukprot:XP_009829112.1 hypothetical protein H257_05817 [Aphanomyces astaci]
MLDTVHGRAVGRFGAREPAPTTTRRPVDSALPCKQSTREEAARVAAAQALADVEQQKAATAALKLERKWEMAREEAEKAQRRQLAVEQWTLAKRHHLRALVLFQGWRPWRHLVAMCRTKAIKAKHWHHDTTLHQRFGAWVGYRDACRAQARAIRTARLRAAATWHDKRWLNRVMLQWQAVREATVQRELSVRTASHNHLVRRLWGVVKSLTDARKAQLCRLQVKREADAKRRVLHVWSCRVGVWRKEAAAKREKDRMWRQMHVWLADDNN